jgi:RNA polymerase sigma-70 factor (ECF subfamily)
MFEQKDYNIHQDLINRCIKGDTRAQHEIYRLYYKSMYNTCYRMLNDSVEAEDVMQEAFLAAFLKIRTYRGEMSFGSWLKRIVVNRTIDVLRTRKVKFEEWNEKISLPEESTESENPDGLDRVNLRVEKIREAVQKLPEGFRVVLTLALFEGYDHEEIAMILKISESTSRSQLARAKRKLVECIKAHKDETIG